jgi:glucosylceramidase
VTHSTETPSRSIAEEPLVKNVVAMLATLSLALFSHAAEPEGHKLATVYTTAQDIELRLARQLTVPISPSAQPPETDVCVFVDPAKTFQTVLGIGGALTDASAEVFAKLSPARQKEILTAYFDRHDGVNLSRDSCAHYFVE